MNPFIKAAIAFLVCSVFNLPISTSPALPFSSLVAIPEMTDLNLSRQAVVGSPFSEF
jgi:hypothetical protein